MTKPAPKIETVDGPARLTPLHVQDNVFSTVAGSPCGWRLNSILEALYNKGKLGELKSHAALNRLDAGRHFSKLFWQCEPHGKDSTQALNGGRTGGSGGIPLSIIQEEAGRAVRAIESHLGQKDKIILRAVCRDDMLPHQGVKLADCDVETRVFARFRDALDELGNAITKAGKAGSGRVVS